MHSLSRSSRTPSTNSGEQAPQHLGPINLEMSQKGERKNWKRFGCPPGIRTPITCSRGIRSDRLHQSFVFNDLAAHFPTAQMIGRSSIDVNLSESDLQGWT